MNNEDKLKLSDNQKTLLYKNNLSLALLNTQNELSAINFHSFKFQLNQMGLQLPKSYQELYKSCPRCHSVNNSIELLRRSRSNRKSKKEFVKNYIGCHCMNCSYEFRLKGTTNAHLKHYEEKKQKYISSLKEDPSLRLEEMSSASASSSNVSSRAASPMPLNNVKLNTHSRRTIENDNNFSNNNNDSNKKRKKGKQPSSLQELLQRNKLREKEKQSKSTTTTSNSKGLGAFLSSYDM